jgi:hypothetical protein
MTMEPIEWGAAHTHKLQTDGWVWIPDVTNNKEYIEHTYATLYQTSTNQLERDPPISLTVSHQSQSSLQCYALSNPMENMAFYGWTGGGIRGTTTDGDCSIVPLELQRIWHCYLQEGETIRILRHTHRPVVAGHVMRAVVVARRRVRLPIPWNACPMVCRLSPLPANILRRFGEAIPSSKDNHGGVLFCMGSLCFVDEGPREWWTCPPRSWINAPIGESCLDVPIADAAHHSSITHMDGCGWQETKQCFVAAVSARLIHPSDKHLFRTLGLVHRDICREAATMDLQMDWERAMQQFLVVPQLTPNIDGNMHLLSDEAGVDGAVHYAFQSYDPCVIKQKNEKLVPVPLIPHGGPVLPMCPRSWILHSAAATFGTQPVIRGFARIEDLSLPYGPPLPVTWTDDPATATKFHYKLPATFRTMGCSYFTVRQSPNEDRHVLVARGKGGGHFIDGPSAVVMLRRYAMPRLSFRRFLLHNPRTSDSDLEDGLHFTFSGDADTGMLQTCLCLCLIALYPMASLDEIVSIGVVIGLHALRDNRTFPISAIGLCMEWQAECLQCFWSPYQRPTIPLSETVYDLIDRFEMPFTSSPLDGSLSATKRTAKHHLRRYTRDPDNTNMVLNPDYAFAQQYIATISRHTRGGRHRRRKPCNKTTQQTDNKHEHQKRIRHIRAALHRTARFERRVDKHGSIE